MAVPTGVPQELQGRGTFRIKNINQLTKQRDYGAPTTENQPDLRTGRTLTPAQPADKGRYDGRYPPTSTILPNNLKFHRPHRPFSITDIPGYVDTPYSIAHLRSIGALFQDLDEKIRAEKDLDPVRVMVCGGLRYVAPSDAARALLWGLGGSKWALDFDGVDDTYICPPEVDGIYEYAAGLLLPDGVDGYGSVLGNYDSPEGGAHSIRYGLFEAGQSYHHSNVWPRAVWRSGVSLNSPYDVAPADEWFVYGLRTWNSDSRARRAIASCDNQYFGRFRIAGLAAYTADLSPENQAKLWSYIASELP